MPSDLDAEHRWSSQSIEHPSQEELARYRNGQLSAEARARLAPHLDQCMRCQGQLDALDPQLAMVARHAPPPPPRLPNYEYVRDPKGFPEVLGHGGLGVVFLARYKGLEGSPPRAIKVLHTGSSITTHSRERFRREIAAISRLSASGEAGFVQVFEGGEREGCLYYVMEFIAGGNLQQWRKEHRPTPRQAAEWLLCLAKTVAVAHRNGIFHRDLKPSNILVVDEEGVAQVVRSLKIADFSHARLRERPSDLSVGELVGTPNYMAPEQARGEPADARVDVYGLCSILYELLTGRPPYHGRSALVTLEMVRSPDTIPLPPSSVRPELARAVYRDLVAICMKGLEKEADRRYATVDALAEDVHRFLVGEATRARPIGTMERGWRWCRRRPAVVGLSAALLAVAMSGAAGIGVQWRSERATRLKVENNLATIRQLVFKLAQLGKLPPTREFDAQREQRKAILLEAEAVCLRLLQEPQPGPEVRMTLAEVYNGLSEVAAVFSDNAAARAAAEQAVFHWERVAGPHGNPAHDLGLARAYRELAHCCFGQGDSGKALMSFRAAHGRMQRHAIVGDADLLAEFIDLKLALAHCVNHMPDRIEALALFEEARVLVLRGLEPGAPRFSPLHFRLAEIYWRRGRLLGQSLRFEEARNSLELARTLYRQLHPVSPQEFWPVIRWNLAQCCMDIAGWPGGAASDYIEAASLLEDCCRDLNRLTNEDPTKAASVLFGRYLQLAQCYQALGKIPAALDACGTSLGHAEEGMRRNGTDFGFFKEWLSALVLMAQLQQQNRRPVDAAATLNKLGAGIDRLVHNAKAAPLRRATIAAQLMVLSREARYSQANVHALQAAEGSRLIFEELAAETPTELAYQAGLSDAWAEIAKCYWPIEKYEQVLHACRQALTITQRICASEAGVQEYRARLDDRHVKLERILSKMGRREEVLASLLEREKLWPGNGARLRLIVRDLRKLADEVSEGKKELSPVEQAERQRYLDHGVRIERAAEKAASGNR